jgi:hypothetical protein
VGSSVYGAQHAQAAPAPETDDDPERFEERLRKLVKHELAEKPE